MFVWITDIFRPTWLRWSASIAANAALLVLYAIAAAVALRAWGVPCSVLEGAGVALLVAPFAAHRRYSEARGDLLVVIVGLWGRSVGWIIGAVVWAGLATVLAGSLRT